MSSRPRRSVVPPEGPAGRDRAGARAVAGAAARVGGVVVGLAFLSGVGAGAVVQPWGIENGSGTADGMAVASAGLGADGEAAGRSGARGEVPSEVDPVQVADDVVSGDVAGDTAGAVPDVADGAVVSPDADLRPIPLPRLVPRDTQGPLWLTPQDREAGLSALDVPEQASGVLDVVPGGSSAPGAVGARAVRVEVERGLPVDGAAFAAFVMATLNDPRGWGARGDVSFGRTDGPADLRVVLASPALVDALCAPLDTGGQVSCGRNGHAALNFRRWVLATDEFTDRTRYRQYLVNHEVGHLLGHPHERCPAAGQPAPLMQQQSVRAAPCVPNGWPYP